MQTAPRDSHDPFVKAPTAPGLERAQKLGVTYGRVLLIVGLLQLLLLMISIRHEGTNLLSRPINQSDFAYHWYCGVRFAESLQSGAGNAAYDPSFLGGMEIYPHNTPSGRFPIFLMTLTPREYWAFVFNACFLLMMFSMPLLLTGGLIRFRIPPSIALFASLIGLAVFWVILTAFLRQGMVTFGFSILAAFYLMGETYALTQRFSHWRASLILIASACLTYIHPTTAFNLPVFLLPIFFWQRKNLNPRMWLYALGAATLTVALNWGWLRTYPTFSYSYVPTNTGMTFRSWQHFWSYHINGERGFQLWRFTVPILFVTPTLWHVAKQKHFRALAFLSGGWTLFFTGVYIFGSFIPGFNQIQPRRYGVAVSVCFTFYVAVLAMILIAHARESANTKPMLADYRRKAWALALMCLLASVIQAFRVDIVSTLADHPLMQVAAMVNSRTQPGDRLFFSRGPYTLAPFVNTEQFVVANYAPRDYLGNEVILQSISKFGRKRMGGQSELSEAIGTSKEWREFRDTWGIDYVIFPSQFETLYAGWMSELRLVDRAGGYSLYQSETPPRKRFLKGTGTVTARLNRLSFQNVTPDADGTILVAYHYSVGMHLLNAPNATLSRRTTPGDEYGLIEVTNPPPDFEIVFKID